VLGLYEPGHGLERRKIDDVYPDWIQAHDTLDDSDRRSIRAHVECLPFKPVFSLILPIYPNEVHGLRAVISAVNSQLYPYWELLIVAREPLLPSTAARLRYFEIRDQRSKIVQSRLADRSLAAAVNFALGIACGDFVVFLDQNDLLPEHALYEIAFEIGIEPDVDILYTDFDHVLPDGHRFGPFFKPGWSLDLLLAYDVVSHVAAYRRALVSALGGLSGEFEGAEYHDLALRAATGERARAIHHVSSILCHRRPPQMVVNVMASRHAVRAHLERSNIAGARVVPAPLIPQWNRVVYPLPEPPPLVSVIVPIRDRPDLLSRCADGVLRETEYSHLELIIVDNDSSEPGTIGLLDRLLAEPRVRVLHHPGAFNYAAMNRVAVRQARGEVIILLNNDIEVIHPDWLRELVSQAIRPDVGVVGSKLLYRDGRLQHGGVVVEPGPTVVHLMQLANRGDPGPFGELAVARDVSAVTGACLAIRRVVFDEIGALDTEGLPVAFNDIDLCLRARAHGYRIIWTPHAELFHHESATRGHEDTPEKHARLVAELRKLARAWGAMAEVDPFLNSNLHFNLRGEVSLASPPRRLRPWRQAAAAFSA
jgi:GT2 family glycosyltransferase